MYRRAAIAALASLAALATACGSRSGPDAGAGDGEALVLAAASLADALDELRPAYEAASGGAVKFSFAASGTLAAQVRRGAPGDAVIFAGTGPMDDLEAAGLIERGSRRTPLGNRLVVIARPGTGQDLREVANVADPGRGRVAIASPDSAPAGAYAREALQSAGVWQALREGSRLIEAVDVRAAAAAVQAGGADYGIVYATDAAAMPGVAAMLEVPESSHSPILYAAGVLAGSGRKAAAGRFLDFLASSEAQVVFKRHGFLTNP
jgi:molybdate transport system substrate-binding protein